MNSVPLVADEHRALHAEALGIALVSAASVPLPLVVALAVAAWIRGHGVAVVVSVASPLIALAGPIPEAWSSFGALEAAAAFLGVYSVLVASANGGHHPAQRGSFRSLSIPALGAIASALLVHAQVVVGAGRDVRLLATLAPPLLVAWVAGSTSRATRAFRHELREAIFLALALAVVARAGSEFVPVAGFAFVLGGYGAALPAGAGLFVLVCACCMRLANGFVVTPAAVVAVSVVLGAAQNALRSFAHPRFGVRFRSISNAVERLARRGSRRTHRVGVALADARGTSFLIDWHRPATQLVVDRIGVLRRASALPAPELVAALEAAPDEVLAADDLHPYVVGAADVQGASRCLAVRGACAAALLREDESGEVCGVLYVVDGPRDPLDAQEAEALRRLADVVSASITQGSEPAIAARMNEP